ncbi:MAG: hypothetical protein AB7U79_01500 [Candidatus Izemoplasmatales bacterium]
MDVLKNPSSYQIILFFDEAERIHFHKYASYLYVFRTILLITTEQESLVEIMME